MDIPNLSQTPTPVFSAKKGANLLPLIIIVGIVAGFVISRVAPSKNNASSTIIKTENGTAIEATIEKTEDIKIGKVYGNASATYKDSATGIVQKGNINGVGTHVLIREGGESQKASLISSAIDLDLFVDKKVEVKGETNASKKTSWLLDVGTIKVIE